MSRYDVHIDTLDLIDREHPNRTLHYERDYDLEINCKAARQGGTVAATVLVELGIDGGETHKVRFDVDRALDDDPDAVRYSVVGDEVRALTDAIEAMTALRDELARAHGADRHLQAV